jgi:aldehyde dehydrogenase (NAD+)
MQEVVDIAKKAAERIVVGPPNAPATTVGPVVSEQQFDKIQRLIQSGIDEGATLVVGGLGRPEGLTTGYYVRPTIFANVTNDMTIAREEIFGPVMTFIGYEDEADAIRIANDSNYGLAGMVSSGNLVRARKVARRIRTGMVHLNGAPLTQDAPFGGYKQSGNGREFGKFGLHDFLESKAIYGDRVT